MTVVWVMVAGGLGSGARYLIGQWSAHALGASFPYGTLLVNLVGCFLLGAVVQFSASGSWSPELRAAIASGFIGGFTTYSSFNQETIALLTGTAAGTGVLYLAITVVGGLAAGSLGLALARAIQS
jgi:CrcB protein